MKIPIFTSLQILKQKNKKQKKKKKKKTSFTVKFRFENIYVYLTKEKGWKSGRSLINFKSTSSQLCFLKSCSTFFFFQVLCILPLIILFNYTLLHTLTCSSQFIIPLDMLLLGWSINMIRIEKRSISSIKSRDESRSSGLFSLAFHIFHSFFKCS